jgi:tetratricopeptide (TPR) repeat protein
MVLHAPNCCFRIAPVVLLLLLSCDVRAQRSLPFTTSEVLPALAPKLQKELGKALEALRLNKPAEARHYLDAVLKVAPSNVDANFLFGIYFAEMTDWAQATSYWEKVLILDPNHLNALLGLSEAFLRDSRPAEAVAYLQRAVQAEPTSWRAHAMLADADLRQGALEESIKEANRALELGHSQAESVQPLLARALQLHGAREQALQVLQAYLKDHPNEAASTQLLAMMQGDAAVADEIPFRTLAAALSAETSRIPATLLSSRWLPPDIDERLPPVETGTACDLERVLQKSGERIEELVVNVDKFTATEMVNHQSIDKWGFASRPVRLNFDYLVSIKENRLGLLSVEEHRHPQTLSTKFPDDIETTGLPALVLIFHPNYVKNFKVSCEGLAQSHGIPAWQIYFRQRTDKPNLIRTYQIGIHGPVYAVALKGRAWIAADTFQIVRLETDLIDAVPQIRLVSDHAAVEYGPVHFNSRNLDMWLPQNADLHYDWRGRRAHRRHTFKNYLLFAIDDNQKISLPKAAATAN